MCRGLNSHDFHIIGDGHQPNSRGLYTHYKDSVIKGGRSPIPNIGSLDKTMAHMSAPGEWSCFFYDVFGYLHLDIWREGKDTMAKKWYTFCAHIQGLDSGIGVLAATWSKHNQYQA